MIENTILFQRNNIKLTYDDQKYLKLIKQKLNLSTLFTFNKNKIYSLYNVEHEDAFLYYRFELLLNWILDNESYTEKFINNLIYIINILDLEKYLNGYEQNYLNHYQSLIFSQTRNLKKLIVDFETLDNENIYYQYEINDIYEYDCNKLKNQIINKIIYLYISDKRLIISINNEIKYLMWKQINQIKIYNNSLCILWNNNQQLIIYSLDLFEIYVAIERVCNLINYYF